MSDITAAYDDCEQSILIELEAGGRSTLDDLASALTVESPLSVLIHYNLPVTEEWELLLTRWGSLRSALTLRDGQERSKLIALMEGKSSNTSWIGVEPTDHLGRSFMRFLSRECLANKLLMCGRLSNVSGDCSTGKTQLLLSVLAELTALALNLMATLKTEESPKPPFRITYINVYHPFNTDHFFNMYKVRHQALGGQPVESASAFFEFLQIYSEAQSVADLRSVFQTLIARAPLQINSAADTHVVLIDDVSLLQMDYKKDLLEFYQKEMRAVLRNGFSVLQTSGCLSRGLLVKPEEDSLGFLDTSLGTLTPPPLDAVNRPWLDSLVNHSYVDISAQLIRDCPPKVLDFHNVRQQDSLSMRIIKHPRPQRLQYTCDITPHGVMAVVD